MTRGTRTRGAILAAGCALLAFSLSANAQTAVPSFDPGANAAIYAIAVQPDGKILVGGSFTMLGGGGSGSTPRNHIGRLNADGSLDTEFNPGADSYVYAIAVQPDGKILVGGDFSALGDGGSGTARHRIGRLNADGSVDGSFDPGANSAVYAFAIQPDGKIVAVGSFTMLGGGGAGTTVRHRIGRLDSNGSLDVDFNPGANAVIISTCLQRDGKIVVAGLFTMLGGGGTGTTARSHIGRIDGSGSLDTGFDPGANGDVVATALQPDGKILVGGTFSMLGGGGSGTTERYAIGRINSNGSLDPDFNPGANSTVLGLAVQADGKIVAGGYFSMLGGGERSYVGRLNANGSLDAGFDPGADNSTPAVAVRGDGGVLVGGSFSDVGGAPRSRIALLSNPDASVQDLSVAGDGTSVTWLRGGGSPEVARASFEFSTDGLTYTPLGAGSYVSGGWQITGLSLPVEGNRYVRARGFYATGQSDGSGSIVESVWRSVAATRSDFDGDLTSDVMWRNIAQGDIWLWSMAGGAKASEAYVGTVADLNWEIRGQGDQDGDGKSDFLWRNKATGMIYYWRMDGGTPAGESYVSTVDLAYDIIGTGDFDGDGKSDILWRNTVVGDVWVWRMDGATVLGEGYVDTVGPGYVVKGIGDLDGDTAEDVVWYGAAGDVWAWLMDGTAKKSQAYVGTVEELAFQIQQVADFDGDRKADLLWWNNVSGEVWIWQMDGTSVASKHFVGVVPETNYRVMAAGDYNGDTRADILWRHATRGDLWVWLMNGPVKESEIYLGMVPDTNYQIVLAK